MSESEEIAKAVVAALNKEQHIDNETHSRHHKYIESLIDRDKQKAEMFDQIKLQVMKLGVLGLLSGLGIAVWQYILHLIKNTPSQ